MDDEKLISLIKAYPCLYNKYDKKYKLLDVKHIVWNRIAKEMGCTDKQCIKRWSSLRDMFSRECRKLDAPLRSSARLVDRTWPLFKSMQFLKEHVVSRPSRSSVNRFEIPISCSSVAATAVSDPLQPPGTSDPPPSPRVSPPLPSLKIVPLAPISSTDSLNTSEHEGVASAPKTSYARKKRKPDMDKEFLDAVDAFIEYVKAQRTQRGEDSVFGFTQMMVAKLSEMSSARQARTMLELHQVVLEAELEE